MPPWIRQVLPDWAHVVLAWLMQPLVLTVIAISSVLFFVLTIVGIPIILTRMPADFFSRPERDLRGEAARSRWYWASSTLKNVLGGALLLLGVLLLVLPGQGILTILVGVLLLDLPGKRRVERWLISRPSVHRPINALRQRAGRPPLEVPPEG